MAPPKEYWNRLAIGNLRSMNRWFRQSPVILNKIIGLIGIVLSGWLIISGIIDCSLLIKRYVVPEYRNISSPPSIGQNADRKFKLEESIK